MGRLPHRPAVDELARAARSEQNPFADRRLPGSGPAQKRPNREKKIASVGRIFRYHKLLLRPTRGPEVLAA